MKLISSIMIAIVCFVTPALAYDMTYIGAVAANQTKTVKVYLPTGKSTVEVNSTTGTHKFNCRFGSDGRVLTEQQNVSKCVTNPVAEDKLIFEVTIVNLEDKTLDYRIFVQDFIGK